MALNPFFTQGTKNEQNLVQDIVNEQLKMYGVECYYLPRKYLTTTTIIREVIQSKFDDAYPLEAYVNNYDVYQGNGTRELNYPPDQKKEILSGSRLMIDCTKLNSSNMQSPSIN